ncbi:MAG: polysaccharide deacetylase family protein [Clostridia bacterium]
MKRLFSVFLVFIMLCVPVYAQEITLYSADGRKITVQSDEADLWRRVGWYDWEEVYTTLYSEDGRSIDALKSQLEQWKAVGWYENMSDVQTTLYSWTGEQITVWNSEVDSYLADGWGRTAEEMKTTLYSEDGRDITVWNAYAEAYLAVGWYRTPDEVQTTLYSADGRSIVVWNAEIDAYLAVGWYRERPGIDPNKPMVALTFDDGPGPYTDRILDCLEKYGAKATFFVVGNRLSKYPSVLKRQAELGMEIGCHTWSHTQLTTLGAGGIANQINSTNNKVLEIAGVYPSTLRPPYGSYNSTVKSAANAPLIMWSIDTLDWKTRSADSTYNAVMNNVKDGDIILMHDIHSATADAVERIVPALIERGYQLVTVSQMGQYKKGGLQNGVVYGKM